MDSRMENNLFPIVAAAVCMTGFLVYSAYLFGLYMRFVFYRDSDRPYNHEPVSIIIAARNEAANLEAFLPSVLQQDRDTMEVIVVNDGSSDATADVLARYAARYPFLKILSTEKPVGKKRALTLAIQQARYELLLFTDADCKPASPRWASEMLSQFRPGIDLVLGYGGYEVRKGLLNRFVQLDTALIAARYAGFCLWGKPYMGVGRNLAYRKSLWLANNGFAAHDDLPYGDDDLFVMQASRKNNTALCFDPMAFTVSVPPGNFAGWFRQKTRHLHAGKRYGIGTSLLLGAEPVSELLFWMGGIALLAYGWGLWFLFLASFYLLYKGYLFRAIYKKLKINTKWNFLSILSVGLSLALFLMGINAIFAKTVTWKRE